MNEEMEVVKREGLSALTLKQVVDRVNLVHEILQKVMVRGTHYDKVPGCGGKDVLLKPGADLLAMTFQLVPQFTVTKPDLTGGHREFDVTCSMYSAHGVLMGQGVGSASTMEKKYRYRWEGEGPNRRRIENEDIADVYNTVLKIAKKRAQIDATLTVTGAADIFTQDLIETEDGDGAQEARQPVAEPKAKNHSPEAGKPAGGANSAEKQVSEGVLDEILISPTKKGGTRYGLKLGNDIYGSFDDKVGELAKTLKGSAVKVTWHLNGEYRNVDALEAADDLPYN